MFKANYTINYNHFKMRTTFLFYLSNLIILKFYFNIQSLCSHYHFFLYLYPISFELSYNPKQLLLLTQISNKSETPFNTLLSYFIAWHTSLLFIAFFLLFFYPHKYITSTFITKKIIYIKCLTLTIIMWEDILSWMRILIFLKRERNFQMNKLLNQN